MKKYCELCGFENPPAMHDKSLCVFCSNLPEYTRDTYSDQEREMYRTMAICMNELLHQINLRIK